MISFGVHAPRRLQSTRRIPTPLSDPRDRPRVEILDSRSTPRFQPFVRLKFVTSLLVRRLAVRLWPRLGREGGRFDPVNNARYIRRFCERMGGLWIKVGQILAMRRDIFSQAFCEELARLHDRAHGFPGDQARAIVEQELGAPVERYFEEFNTAPLAAASIGQIHEARLKGTRIRVVIKVQRPEVAGAFQRDLRFLRRLIRIIQFLGVLASGRWDEMLWELDKTFTEELDYRLEASSLTRMRKQLRRHKVYVPKVFAKVSTRRVLVMEFIQGVFMSEYIQVARRDPDRVRQWNEENNVSPKRLGRRLYLSHLEQVFEDNLYHCDLHPGNVVILRDSRFALIDFGSIASFEAAFLEKYSMMFNAIALRDFTKVVDIMLMTSPALPNIDLTDLRAELIRAMRAWELKTSIKRAPYHEKSLTAAMAALAEILGKYKVPPAWEYLRLQRAEITLDSALSLLMPDVNYVRMARIYMEQSQRRVAGRLWSPRTRLQLASAVSTLAALPMRLSENLTFDAEWLRKRAMQFGSSLSTAASVAVLVVGLFIQIAGAAAFILLAAHVYPEFRNQSTLLDQIAAAEYAVQLIALEPGVKLFVAIVLVAALVFFVRLRRRLTAGRGYNPGTGYQ